MGLHGNTGGRGSRAEKKSRINDNRWKDKYFESKWGDRSDPLLSSDTSWSVCTCMCAVGWLQWMRRSKCSFQVSLWGLCLNTSMPF